ncbi:hypothetical protein [Micromonospora inyonensis]|uniref:Uncharacterized protein n=1 Tax=Micromonospora inyonensis TaxID=47866 RepID=A0A1C6SVI0_9ACTN|nr:hypothetical protein [Micromonospora inyonensis]SCL15018.1 hypothetical protein GA0074694_1017 [Micromonospora inyonensis]SCL33541.1 hypothetical protein GA0074694_6254 [Micromonospora inyonensis]
MHIIADARSCAHTTPTRRGVASYAGPASGLRAALLTSAALGRPTVATALTAGGAR